jgi:hypothetical protein
MPEPITIFGGAPAVPNPFQSGLNLEQMSLTRHHIIPHSMLIDAWEHAVDRSDMELIKAFTVWAGKDPTRDLPANFLTIVPEPQTVLRKVAWNPFNIVIGPLSEHRVEDPGAMFDLFEFRSFIPAGAANPRNQAEVIKLRTENLARQDFNRHLRVLRRIYNILVRYLTDQVANQDVDSLRELLKSDVPAKYAYLDSKFRQKALLSPDLWANYSMDPTVAPEEQFTFASNRATGFQNKTVKIVPWNAVSWLPEVEPKLPKSDALDTSDDSVWQPGEANPPYDRLLLSRLEYKLPMGEALFRVNVVSAARRAGKFKARVILFGPPGSRSDVARWTASEMKKLNREGYELKISRVMFEAGNIEVRFYDFLR